MVVGFDDQTSNQDVLVDHSPGVVYVHFENPDALLAIMRKQGTTAFHLPFKGRELVLKYDNISAVEHIEVADFQCNLYG